MIFCLAYHHNFNIVGKITVSNSSHKPFNHKLLTLIYDRCKKSLPLRFFNHIILIMRKDLFIQVFGFQYRFLLFKSISKNESLSQLNREEEMHHNISIHYLLFLEEISDLAKQAKFIGQSHKILTRISVYD